MKSKNLKIIIGVEIGLLVCLCIGGGVGAFFYLGNQPAAESGSSPLAQPAVDVTSIPLPTEILPTEIPTETPTPGPSGTTLEKLPDGSAIYTDYDANFELVVPVGWLGLRLNDPDAFDAAMSGENANNVILQEQIIADRAGYDANFDRLYLYILRPDIKKNLVFGFSKMVWDSQDKQSLDNTTMGVLVRGLETSGELPGFRVVASNIEWNPNNVSIMSIRGRFTITYADGGSLPVIGTVIFFKPTSNSTVRIIFTMIQDFDPQISPDVESIVASIKLLGK